MILIHDALFKYLKWIMLRIYVWGYLPSFFGDLLFRLFATIPLPKRQQGYSLLSGSLSAFGSYFISEFK
jgi:hypothetical protein